MRFSAKMKAVPATVICLLLAAAASSTAEEPEKPITDQDRRHWSFLPPVRPALPAVKDAAAVRNPIDRFILARLEENNLSFAPEADRRTLLRRLSFDLTGLPPTPQEIDDFLNDRAPDAWQHVVSRLLASSAYGERWAQHWLDVARFAESDGFEFDHERKEAWRYRDWVIEALNRDLPYDQFVQWQLAGDERVPDTEEARIATGFLVAGPDMIDINLATERRHEFLNKMTQAVGEVFLGLTLGCAQCHAHKTDPVSIEDFYRFRAIFANTVVNPKKSKQLAHFIAEPNADPPDSFVMQRGDFRRPGTPVDPALLRIANPGGQQIAPAPPGAISSQRRAALATWLTRAEHPLTSRVIVNRLWQHHFGRALVPTPNDFGHTGKPPSHPELLDWLACELPRRKWSLKAMHRLMVTSRTYRQASRGSGEAWSTTLERDPENLQLSRMSRRRLEGEAIRDSFLAAAGLLNRKAGGPSVRPPLPREVTSTLLKNQWKVSEDPADHNRRSIYIFVRRNLRYPIFDVFDRPDTNASCPRRNESTTPTQSLTLLNSAFTLKIATTLADRVASAGSTRSQIELLYLHLFGRPPTARELQIAAPLLDAGSFSDLCLALLNTNEALYVD
ncbi:MAG: DUF1549 and DUF1553 domain-containing protein [Roseibacillus sp.]